MVSLYIELYSCKGNYCLIEIITNVFIIEQNSNSLSLYKYKYVGNQNLEK